jgi:uncharacterized protein (TIGR00730 family)
MSEHPFSVCVFCASSEAVAASERAIAAELGAALADRGWRLVYGGGGIGLMGEVARAVLRAGGDVLGVIPHRLATREVALPEVTELVLTDTMRERKHRMDAESDAFVVLPGGIGTLEELVEILTLKQLGYHHRPIVVLDAEGFWAPLLAQLDRMVDAWLAAPSVLDLFSGVRDVPAALDAIAVERGRAPQQGDGGDAAALELVEAPPGEG